MVRVPDLSTSRRAGSRVVVGDEYIYSDQLCPACDHYTVESYRDSFMGRDEITTLGPVSRAVGDRGLLLIAECPEPGAKYCDCASHKVLYYGLPSET